MPTVQRLSHAADSPDEADGTSRSRGGARAIAQATCAEKQKFARQFKVELAIPELG
jgi:hypothetical protein